MQERPDVTSEGFGARERYRSLYAIALAAGAAAVFGFVVFFASDFTSRIGSMDLALSGITTPTSR
jgi:hypothetical protein